MNFLQRIISKIIFKKFFDISVNENNELDLTCHIPINIKFNNGVSFIVVNDEMNIISINQKINIDTINNKLYLNSRSGKIFNSNKETCKCPELPD